RETRRYNPGREDQAREGQGHHEGKSRPVNRPPRLPWLRPTLRSAAPTPPGGSGSAARCKPTSSLATAVC
ncbi:MAG TPA: hypothetical protein VE957_00820, partial [Terriglobales bacterium]|nr:hypothetical protein [Terriglobales bacterium]